MSNTKFTEGEWLIKYDNSDSREGGKWFNVGPAKIHYDYGSTEEEDIEVVANANLIASSPLLYKALEDLVKSYVELGCDFGHDMSDEEELIAARKALASAKGDNHEQ